MNREISIPAILVLKVEEQLNLSWWLPAADLPLVRDLVLQKVGERVRLADVALQTLISCDSCGQGVEGVVEATIRQACFEVIRSLGLARAT